jgi:hypothetical protein
MIIMPDHVKKTVQGVEHELTKSIMSELPRSSLRFIETDGDVDIDGFVRSRHGKRQDVRGRVIIHPTTMQKRHLSIVHDLDRTPHAGTTHTFDELAQCVDDEFGLVFMQQTSRVEDFDRVESNLRVGTKPSRLPGFRRLGLGGISAGALLNIIHVGRWHHE